MAQFPDDEKKPLFTWLEGEGAIRYVDLEIDVANALERKSTAVHLQDGTVISYEEANGRLATLYQEFARTVEDESRELYPTASVDRLEEIVDRRKRDILDCHRTTDHQCQHMQDDGDSFSR